MKTKNRNVVKVQWRDLTTEIRTTRHVPKNVRAGLTEVDEGKPRSWPLHALLAVLEEHRADIPNLDTLGAKLSMNQLLTAATIRDADGTIRFCSKPVAAHIRLLKDNREGLRVSNEALAERVREMDAELRQARREAGIARDARSDVIRKLKIQDLVVALLEEDVSDYREQLAETERDMLDLQHKVSAKQQARGIAIQKGNAEDGQKRNPGRPGSDNAESAD